MLIAILVFIIILYLIKVSNNHEVIKKNCKDDYDKANIKNAKKVYSKSKVSVILLVAFFISLIVLILCHFTSIEAIIINYFSTDFYIEEELNYDLYFIPAYLFICRELLIQINLADYLFKYFKVEEEHIEGKELIKSLLYKKKKVKSKTDEVKVDDNEQVDSDKTSENTVDKQEQNNTEVKDNSNNQTEDKIETDKV